MAEVKLNTTSSITDFLKSQGKDSSYGARSSLYKTSGLEERLGAYVGSAAQNTAFLKNLQTPAQTGEMSRDPAPVGDVKPLTTGPVTTPSGAVIDAGTGGLITPPPTPEPTPTDTIGSSGLTASQAASSIPQMPSADEILQSVLSSSGFQNFQQGKDLSKELDIGNAQAQKQALEVKTAADTKAFVTSIGRRGLFFSGETTTQLQALAESLASSKLGVDRKLAGQLLQSNLDTKEKIIDQVGQLVKDAQQGRKDAISALEKVGLTVIGDQVVPTLAARSAELSEANRQADNARADMNARLAIQREERLTENMMRLQENSDRSFALSVAASNRAAEAVARGSQADREDNAISSFASAFVAGATLANGIPILDSSGWVTPEAWKAAIADAPKEGLTRDKFIKDFGYLLFVDGKEVDPKYGLTPQEKKLVVNP